MTAYSKRVPESTSVRKALPDIGGEPLAGSGFEDETPESEVEGVAEKVDSDGCIV